MRKQILLAAILFVCCGQASAQLDKGNFYIGISSENRFLSSLSYKSYGVKPALYYALDKHSLIGISYNHSRTNTYSPFTSTDIKGYGNQYGIGISYNYFRYFKRSNKLGWYVNANLDYNRVKYYSIKNTGQAQLNNQYNQSELSIKPGIFFKPAKNFFMFANVGGISLINTEGGIDAPVTFGRQINVGVLINLGIFRKKNKF